MREQIVIVLITWVAGLTAWCGGVFAKWEGSPETEIKREFVHAMVAFGGGALLAAVAFALAPHGMQNLSVVPLTLSFLCGALVFCALDATLARKGGNFAQFLAMLMDFVPEALSLGAVFSSNRKMGWVLAAFIGLQNLPEGFNAFREMTASGNRARRVLWVLLGVSFLGPLAALAGYYWLSEREVLTAGIMTFASGGILYLIFQDIAPQATMRRHWTPPLGAILGFLLGMVGTVLMS